MKTIRKFVVILIVCFLIFVLTGQRSTSAQEDEFMVPVENNSMPGNPMQMESNTTQDIDDEDSLPYEPDILSRKVFQKKMEPLSNKEKIIWSFRMAETNSFL